MELFIKVEASASHLMALSKLPIRFVEVNNGRVCPFYLFYLCFICGGDLTIGKELRVNEEITAKELRLIGVDGEQIGIVSPREALAIAREAGLDLVEVAPHAKPPVCRIMDYGKYKFQQSKREKEARKKQKVVNVKEVKFRLGIEDHDFEVKARNIERFLKKGDKVKVTVMFRGREISHSDMGLALCNRIIERVGDVGSVEKPPKLEGKNMIMVLSPKQEKKQ
ncbi:MAG: Translation initiation factor IF-3 [Clostridia bacterium 41_269]|nr:MAG: Translation initiation factor IF-3 [Clostridia bacterium 41_269]